MTTTPSDLLVLASSSRFRRELLTRLGLPFECVSPDVDETPRPGETPAALAARLAEAKAATVASAHPGATVIGSDQVGDCDGRILSKPGTPAANVEQLLEVAGRNVIFHTGLCVARDARRETEVVPYAVRFRAFDAATVRSYVAREPAHDCAGGFRSEGLGVALFERMHGDDPTALVGLPLIRTCALLRDFGMDPLAG